MTAKKIRACWAEIRGIIKKDATLKGFYLNKDGSKQCVIGGLAVAKRLDDLLVSEPYTFEIKGDGGDMPEGRNAETAAELLTAALEKAFPILDADRIYELQQMNDSCDNTVNRRRALINQTVKWEAEDAKDVKEIANAS